MSINRPIIFRVGHQRVRFYANGRLAQLSQIVPGQRLILVTDQNVYRKHLAAFKSFDTIVLRAGEQYKIQATADGLIEKLIRMEADRQTVLVGVGGGVVTDLVGYVASIFLRGISFGFVPTTLLAMVDASIGGKNGVDVGVYKNLVGTIRQPLFLLHDHAFLSTLPDREWSNGFAEIIKHACIGDEKMFSELCRRDLNFYKQDASKRMALIARNVRFKFRVASADVLETGERKKLNFGHTLGHALEMHYDLSHGEAISLGMVFAASLSEAMHKSEVVHQLQSTFLQYGLPASAKFSAKKVLQSLRMDKKRVRSEISFILLRKIGQAMIQPIPLKKLEQYLHQYA